MENENEKTFIPRSQSSESLNIQKTKESDFLSSTKQQEDDIKKSKINSRRFAIIPTPNKPKDNKITTDSDQEDDFDETKQEMRGLSNRDTSKEKEKDKDKEPSEEDKFDAFILLNFDPFSGKQNVIEWLDKTENKFKQYHIGRNLRFEAISLLVEGVAKRKYISHRKEIKSFDDFYDFLLSTFEPIQKDFIPSTLHRYGEDSTKNVTESFQEKLVIINDHSIPNQVNTTTKSMVRSCMNNSSNSDDFGITRGSGEMPAYKSTVFSKDLSSSIHEETLSDLRKAIVENLIKNPKTFRGSKDDVHKWVEEIEHLFDIAHIPDPTRLDLVSYSLRSDALEWFKDNRSVFTSWNVFVYKIKKAFTSFFREEIAFKKLELYSQTENQSIRNFFNETIKLCKEADPAMTESTKLKYLLNKTKPSMQYEVRRKRPTSIAEFLEFATEAEELMQLSYMINDNTETKANPQPQPMSRQQPIPSPSPNQSFNNTANNYAPTYPQNNDWNYQHAPNSNSYSNNNYSQSNRQRYSNNSNNRDRRNAPSNNTNNSNPQQRAVNMINTPPPTTTSNTAQESRPPPTSNQCNQLGHEASASPSF